MIKRESIFFKEAAAKMKVSDETREKFARIRERMKDKGARPNPFRRIKKEE